VINREERVQWALQKAQEYLDSAITNIQAGRKYPAAEDIFRSVESSLTAILYNEGIQTIEYDDWSRKFTGRQALQALIRENLQRTGIIEDIEYQTYRNLVNDLHHEVYRPGKTFDDSELLHYTKFAEDILIKARHFQINNMDIKQFVFI
jgi:hypothetical protein